MAGRLSYSVTLIGLAGLSVAIPWWLGDSFPGLSVVMLLTGAIPTLLLLYACAKRVRNWPGITALGMIPLAVIGIMDIVATLREPGPGALIAVLSIAVFFAVLDASRRGQA